MLSQVADRSELISYLNTKYINRTKKPLLSTLVFNVQIIPEQFIEIIEKRRDLRDKYDVSLNSLDEDLFLMEIRKRLGEKLIVGYITIETSNKDVWVVTTDEGGYYVKFVVESLFNRLYPQISRIYLNTAQMMLIIKELKDKYKKENIKLKYTSANIKPIVGTLEMSDFDKGTVQRWQIDTEKDLDDLSKKYRVIIKQLSFSIYDKENMPLFVFYISRNAVCKLRFGFYNKFNNEIISLIINIGYTLKKFYSNRERYLADGRAELKPIQIEYKVHFNQTQLKIFEQNIHNKYLALIIYSGNPYFAANILDQDDGSSYGLTVLKNLVTITPIVKASPESLWKLSNTIQEILGDGEVVNVQT